MNDENLCKEEGAGKSSLARVVWAAKKRHQEGGGKEQSTQCQAVSEAQHRMGVEVRETPYEKTIRAVKIADREKAMTKGLKSRGKIQGYSDGSTMPEPVMESGWGWVINDGERGDTEIARGSGKLQGLQDNFTAEAMGAL